MTIYYTESFPEDGSEGSEIPDGFLIWTEQNSTPEYIDKQEYEVLVHIAQRTGSFQMVYAEP